MEKNDLYLKLKLKTLDWIVMICENIVEFGSLTRGQEAFEESEVLAYLIKVRK